MITAAADGWAVAQSASAGVIEVVLYDGISSGQAESAAERKMVMQSGGHSWHDYAMAGGVGSSAVTQPKSRVIPGNPPATARAKGPAIQEWAMLANIPDDCDKLSGKDFAETARASVCCPAWPTAWPRRALSRIVASQSWNDDMVSIADAMKKVARAAKTESTTTRR
ncbi:hypothetical protein [Verminephrobacter eiseniae]|uniref:hypothetical protein n=1 Tax=Verminephrobacter eiseniae TaxID=364317 RepID=UPI0022377849|nr:hypothetical protein [Verminephrobacter eiseniae]MCW5236579.1 hypothetical protein [Verminephrobacter eiseniae]